MPQTTDGISAANMKVEISTNGTVWTDIGGFASVVEPDGGDRKTGQGFTFTGDTPIITKGKREAMSLKVKAVYTEGASEVFEVVRAAYEAGTALYVRYSPQGGLSGDFMYTSSAGVVTSAPYPMGEAESEDLVFFEFELEFATLTKSAVA